MREKKRIKFISSTTQPLTSSHKVEATKILILFKLVFTIINYPYIGCEFLSIVEMFLELLHISVDQATGRIL